MLRLKRSLSEKIYLLYVNQISKNHWDFKVRGQSKNIYQQTLKPDEFKCSCPDHKTKQTFCKHLLFLVARVAIQMEIASNVSEDKTKWSSNYFNDCSKSWIDRLKSRINDKPPKSIDLNGVGNDCPVCFEEMKEGETLVQCITTCKNYFHNDCIKLWLSSDHNNCPLCRAEWINENIDDEETIEIILLPLPKKLEDLMTLQALKKPRGRKKKSETAIVTTSTVETPNVEPIVKKSRGRKKKIEEKKIEEKKIEEKKIEVTEPIVKKSRGRKKKTEPIENNEVIS